MVIRGGAVRAGSLRDEPEPSYEAKTVRIDTQGRIFLDYSPGRYNGVIPLRPTTSGFDAFGTLPIADNGTGRFYCRYKRSTSMVMDGFVTGYLYVATRSRVVTHLANFEQPDEPLPGPVCASGWPAPRRWDSWRLQNERRTGFS